MAKNVRPILKQVVEESFNGEIDFTSLKKLKEKAESENNHGPFTNPREIKFKDERNCCCIKKRRYYFSYGDRFNINNDTCIDIGLVNSFVMPNIFMGGFLVLCALRLDEVIGLNWFIITIPTWFFIVPIAVLAILHGITSQNKNVTLFEKIVISALVPTGFTLSYILILLKLEEYIDLSFLIIFIPNFVSVIAFYIYTRQLKTAKIVPKQDDHNEEEKEESKVQEN